MIEEILYNKIIDVLPILCVDGFIIKDSKILLLKRNNYPAFGEWWVPGGRVLKNETLNSAIIRKIKDELNLEAQVIKQIGITETIFEKKHTVNICFEININYFNNLCLNSEHSEFSWFSLNDLPILNKQLKNIIKLWQQQ